MYVKKFGPHADLSSYKYLTVMPQIRLCSNSISPPPPATHHVISHVSLPMAHHSHLCPLVPQIWWASPVTPTLSVSADLVGFSCPEQIPVGSASILFGQFPRFATGQCDRLVTCVNYYPRLIKCGPGQSVDDNSLTCVDSELVPGCSG